MATAGMEPLDPERCERYAMFASGLERQQFDVMYWTLFVFNLFVLFSAGYGYIICLEKVEKYPQDSPRRKKTMKWCILYTAGCVAVSLVTVVMEVFALMALQFCDGEDLMALYWSTFTMIQVGALIAVAGIILALLHTLRDRKNPPWALALGTPVLVVAGLFTFVHFAIAKRCKAFKNKVAAKKRGRSSNNRSSSKDRELEEGTLPMSQVNTLAVDADEIDDEDGLVTKDNGGAEIIGLTFDGGPIIHFKRAVPSRLPDSAQTIGHCENDKPIVVCSKESVRLIYGGDEKKKPSRSVG